MRATFPLGRRWSDASDDASLVRGVLAGDAAAFEAVMRRYNRRLFRLARATLRNDADAEDALQEAYVKAYGTLARFRGDASLSTWLAHIVHNECLMRMRRDARRQNVIPIAGDADAYDDEIADAAIERPEEAAMRSQMRALLERHVDALPDGLRAVFVLRAIEDMPVQEVAQCLGLSEVAVRSRHFRARSLLRDALAREMDATEADVFAFAGARCDRIVAGVMVRIGAKPSR
jgi:RNA polymerase sigma-70 factor (ECF subfamily)